MGPGASDDQMIECEDTLIGLARIQRPNQIYVNSEQQPNSGLGPDMHRQPLLSRSESAESRAKGPTAGIDSSQLKR